MNKILQLGYTNKEQINLFIGILLAVLPLFFNIKKERKNDPSKKKLTFTGMLCLLLSLVIIFLNIYAINIEDEKLDGSDIKILFTIQGPPNESAEEIAKKIPQKIYIPNIRIGNAQTSGTFELLKVENGRGRTLSNWVIYKCDEVISEDVKYFPEKESDFDNINVSFHFPTKQIYFKTFNTCDVKLKIKNRTFWKTTTDDGYYFDNIKFENAVNF